MRSNHSTFVGVCDCASFELCMDANAARHCSPSSPSTLENDKGKVGPKIGLFECHKGLIRLCQNSSVMAP